MTNRRLCAIWLAVGLLSVGVCLPCSLAAQGAPSVTMPIVSLRAIATDFDAGRNTIYCYYGVGMTGALQIHVDSLHPVSSPSECDGVGFGFISRIADKPM